MKHKKFADSALLFSGLAMCLFLFEPDSAAAAAAIELFHCWIIVCLFFVFFFFFYYYFQSVLYRTIDDPMVGWCGARESDIRSDDIFWNREFRLYYSHFVGKIMF